jgi:hypothetical protein
MNDSHNDPSPNETDRVANKITDLRIPGEDTVIEVVQAYPEKNREWLRDAPVCDLLAQHYILHAGVMQRIKMPENKDARHIVIDFLQKNRILTP